MNKISLFLILFLTFFLFLSKQVPKKTTDSNPEPINKFTFELYKEILKGNPLENVFFSGMSIHLASGMLYEGAKEKTKEEMERVLFINPSDENRILNVKNLMEELNREKTNQLLVANGLWIQKDFKISKNYLEKIKEFYKGKVENLNFKEDPANSRKIINNWIEENTKERIKDLIPEGALGSSTRMVLTNAIYFKGLWQKEFNKEETKEEDFKTEEKIIKVPMMKILEGEFFYGENENFQILELPYKGETLSMVIILPKNGSLEIGYDTFLQLKKAMVVQKVDVFIPKFKFENKYFLNGIFQNMGIKEIFKETADLSGITGKKNLKVDEIIHQSFIQVDEEGTEAAGATAIIVRVTSVTGRKIPVFRADHPFLFLIQHKKTGTIIFLGKVSKPK